MRFIDSLAKNGIFLGEKNLGLYTNKLADKLDLPFCSVEAYKRYISTIYNLPKTAQIPIITENEYFRQGFVYNIYFHNPNSFEVLSQYSNEAIDAGYLHPREYASLKFNRSSYDSVKIFLSPSFEHIDDTKMINKIRDAFLLPRYELDYKKHEFAHEHNLKLYFGFFDATR